MSEREFWESTPRYLAAKIKAKQRDDREAWVIGRQIAYWSILPHIGKRTIKPTDLGRFAWEKQKKIVSKYASIEELKADEQKFLKLCGFLDDEQKK